MDLIPRLIQIQEDVTRIWAVRQDRVNVMARYTDTVENWVAELQLANLEIWQLEEEARTSHSPDITRTRQETNKYRMNLVSWLDRWFLPQQPSGEFCPDSPGLLLDRLSVLEIKRAEGAAVEDQKADLVGALTQLLSDLASGRKYYKFYPPIKLYRR